MWCAKKSDIYEVGVKFSEEDEALNAAMLKNVSLLENFKEDVKQQEGREISGEEAVAEFTAYLAKMHLKDVF